MNILVAAASFSPSISGVQRHALNLVRCLLARPEVSHVTLAVAPWQRELVAADGIDSELRVSIHVARMSRSAFGRNHWYYARLPRVGAALGADLVHLAFPMPVRARAFACPVVATLHDLYPYEIPANFGFPKFALNRAVLQQCLRNVDAIACVSQATLHSLRRYAPRAAWQKAVCIHNCIVPAAQPSRNTPVDGWRGEPFLLCVAQHRRNKNIPLLLRAFDLLLRCGEIDSATSLFLVGIGGPETGRIRRLISRRGLTRRVRFFEGLSEPELHWCYAQCEALVAPSITEGFGLPVVEGLLAGARIVCSDIPAFREVGGSHCRFVRLDLRAEASLAEAIATALRQPAPAPVEFSGFAAQALAEQYAALYRRLVASHRTTTDPARNPLFSPPSSGWSNLPR